MSFSPEKIREQVAHKIAKTHQLGYKSGGSGHLGHISFEIDKIEEPQQTDKGWLVDYEYTLIIETEFTYYPDNPPHTEPHIGQLYLKEDLEEE